MRPPRGPRAGQHVAAGHAEGDADPRACRARARSGRGTGARTRALQGRSDLGQLSRPEGHGPDDGPAGLGCNCRPSVTTIWTPWAPSSPTRWCSATCAPPRPARGLPRRQPCHLPQQHGDPARPGIWAIERVSDGALGGWGCRPGPAPAAGAAGARLPAGQPLVRPGLRTEAARASATTPDAAGAQGPRGAGPSWLRLHGSRQAGLPGMAPGSPRRRASPGRSGPGPRPGRPAATSRRLPSEDLVAVPPVPRPSPVDVVRTARRRGTAASATYAPQVGLGGGDVAVLIEGDAVQVGLARSKPMTPMSTSPDHSRISVPV